MRKMREKMLRIIKARTKTMVATIKCQGKFMALTGQMILSIQIRFFITKKSLSKRTFNRPSFWETILRNWRKDWTCRTWKINISPRELIWNWMRNSLKWTEIFLTIPKLKMKPFYKIWESSRRTNSSIFSKTSSRKTRNLKGGDHGRGQTSKQSQ